MVIEMRKYDRLERSARGHGRTVSEEIRELLAQGLPDVNPNQGLLDLMAEIERETGAIPTDWRRAMTPATCRALAAS